MQQSTSQKLRITTRGVMVLLILFALTVVTIVWSAGLVSASATGTDTVEVVSYVVRSGDTWWSIAESIADQGEDMRDVVYYLMDLNAQSSAGLQAGQSIVLPKS